MKRRVEFDCLPDSDLVLADIYVPSTIKGENDTEIKENLEEYLDQWLDESGERQLALLGEYGQGTSTGALVFSYHYVQKYKVQLPRIPILFELRGISPKTLHPLEMLSVWASDYRIDPKALMKLQQAGRLLLIFEGFDEMAEVFDAEDRLNHFRSIWNLCFPKSKILITGRSNLFLDDRELKALLGIDEPSASGTYVQALRLQPFTSLQIKKSLRKTDEEIRQEITTLADKDTKFYDIVSRPYLLYLVSQLWKRGNLRMRKHDFNSAVVIGLFIKHSYKRQIEKTKGIKRFMDLNGAERQYFMDGIATYMEMEGLQNQITIKDYSNIVEVLYREMPDKFSNAGSALDRSDIDPHEHRLRDHLDPLEAVKTDVRTYGLLVEEVARQNSLKFSHKSFAEYLVATVVFNMIFKTNEPELESIVKATRAGLLTLLKNKVVLQLSGDLIRISQTNAEINDTFKRLNMLGIAMFRSRVCYTCAVHSAPLIIILDYILHVYSKLLRTVPKISIKSLTDASLGCVAFIGLALGIAALMYGLGVEISNTRENLILILTLTFPFMFITALQVSTVIRSRIKETVTDHIHQTNQERIDHYIVQSLMKEEIRATRDEAKKKKTSFEILERLLIFNQLASPLEISDDAISDFAHISVERYKSVIQRVEWYYDK